MSLRTRITISFVALILTSGIVTTLTGIHFIGSGIIKQAQEKVQLDLNTAREIYNHRLESIKTILEVTVNPPIAEESSRDRGQRQTLKILDQVRHKGHMDMIGISDEEGRVILRTGNPTLFGDLILDYPVIEKALTFKDSFAETQILPFPDMQKEGLNPSIAPQEQGMLLIAAAALVDDANEFIGIIYGGKLLNGIMKLSIGSGIPSTKIKNIKAKTLAVLPFLNMTHGSLLNVRNTDGTRAIGTKVSEQVREQVLSQGAALGR